MAEVVWNNLSFTECLDLLRAFSSLLQTSQTDKTFVKNLLVSHLLKVDTVAKTIDLSTTHKYSSATTDSFTRALDKLEALLDYADNQEGQASEDGSTSKLIELAARNDTRAIRLDLSNVQIDILEDFDQLQKELEQCERQIVTPEPIIPSRQPTKGRNAWHDLHGHLSRLISSCVICGKHGMRLLVASWELQAESMRLLCTHQTSDRWHPIDFCLERSSDQLPQSHNDVCQLCESLTRPSKHRAIQFNYDEKNMWPTPKSKGMNLGKGGISQQLMTLEDWLKSKPYKGHRKALQCVLAQWLGRAYNTPWLPQSWNTQSIWLDEKQREITSYDTLSYIDYQFCAEAAAGDDGLEGAFMMRFALLLLRLELPDTGLEIEDEDDLDEFDLDERLAELLEDETIKKEISRGFKEVLKICHEWTSASSHDRTQIFNKIFAPLKRSLVDDWWLDLPEIPEMPMVFPSDYHEETKAESAVLPDRSLDKQVKATRTAPLRLFDDQINTADSFADEFFTNFKVYRQDHALEPGKIRKRVKIAVLDTGVNEKHVKGLVNQAKLRRKHLQRDDPESHIIVDSQSFVNSSGCKDECGHGTRVLDLLLRTAPDARYYIAKVSENAEIYDDEVAVDSIVNALDWAIEKEVDLINMSFGFVNTTSIHRIQQKLAQAHLKGIKMFAAAANHGLNGPRAYPARAHEVICINAANGRGAWATDLNPHESNPADRFSALGLGIGFLDGESSRSGTSYATPIAIGIVSNAIDYVRYLEGENLFTTQQAQELQHIDGIKHMMREMSNAGWLAPWHLWKDSTQAMDETKYKLKMR